MSWQKAVMILIFLIVLVGSASGIGLVYKLYQDSNRQLRELKTQMALGITPTPEDQNEVVSRVAKHMLLPEEEPKVITLADVDQLKSQQPFFEKAAEGDKVLVYTQKVILYSPTMDKIIEIAQIQPERSGTVGNGLPNVSTESGGMQ